MLIGRRWTLDLTGIKMGLWLFMNTVVYRNAYRPKEQVRTRDADDNPSKIRTSQWKEERLVERHIPVADWLHHIPVADWLQHTSV